MSPSNHAQVNKGKNTYDITSYMLCHIQRATYVEIACYIGSNIIRCMLM